VIQNSPNSVVLGGSVSASLHALDVFERPSKTTKFGGGYRDWACAHSTAPDGLSGIDTGDFMSRNFGLGQRDMSKAGRVALERDSRAKGLSFSSVGTLSARWSSFVKNIHESGVRKMEDITGEHVKQYGRDLADRVEDGLMAASTAQNYVSAIRGRFRKRKKSYAKTRRTGVAA
jgi:hypothetical protein